MWLGIRALPVCTPRTLAVSSLGGPGTAKLGQTQLKPWTDLSQRTDWSPRWLVFNKHTVHECLCNKYIQMIRYSGIKKEHFLIRVKIAKGLSSLPCPTFLESRKPFTLITRDVFMCLSQITATPCTENTYFSDQKTVQSIAERALWLSRKTSKHQMEVTFTFTSREEDN